ncbi:MAG: T9SS type A sorting domain-containing protein [Flavobacteriales bacterium]|nr:T9SS type A sorting domain-containing protein [Flavobacteriales bacterium]
MKKLLLVSALFLLSLPPLRAQSLVNTTWAFHYPDDDFFRYFHFTADTLYWSNDNITYTEHSLISFAGSAMTIGDLAGADMGCPVGQVGNYDFDIANDTLSFDLVSDPCIARGEVIDEGYGVQAPSGIGQSFGAVGITVFPNPSDNGIFHLRIPAASAVYNSLRLVSMDGRVIAQQNLRGSAPVDQDVLLEAPAAGTYLLTLSGADQTRTAKLVVRTP